MRRFEVVNSKHRVIENCEDVRLPIRATKNSAGYDFYATEDVEIAPDMVASFFTDIKVAMESDDVLLITVRSSLGIKHGLMLTNTMGVIDSDFYENPTNDGNMIISLRNIKPQMNFLGWDFTEVLSPDNTTKTIVIPVIENVRKENTVYIKKGDKVAQGIFVKFHKTDDDSVTNKRIGGVGSTN